MLSALATFTSANAGVCSSQTGETSSTLI
jgi:hypothetical protein